MELGFGVSARVGVTARVWGIFMAKFRVMVRGTALMTASHGSRDCHRHPCASQDGIIQYNIYCEVSLRSTRCQTGTSVIDYI